MILTWIFGVILSFGCSFHLINFQNLSLFKCSNSDLMQAASTNTNAKNVHKAAMHQFVVIINKYRHKRKKFLENDYCNFCIFKLQVPSGRCPEIWVKVIFSSSLLPKQLQFVHNKFWEAYLFQWDGLLLLLGWLQYGNPEKLSMLSSVCWVNLTTNLESNFQVIRCGRSCQIIFFVLKT